MNNNINYYLDNHISEENAAKIYDVFIIYLWGNKALRNFFYDYEKIKHINEIFSINPNKI